MKFKIHFLVQVFVFAILYFLLGLNSALIITLFHFIPTPDYVMKKVKFYAPLHRKLFHNVFVIVVAAMFVLKYAEPLVAILAILNFGLHILMDAVTGKGVAIFFPLSEYRFRL